MIRRALLLFALFLATPAIVGAFDAWAFVMIGRTLMVDWIDERTTAAALLAVAAVITWIAWFAWVLSEHAE